MSCSQISLMCIFSQQRPSRIAQALWLDALFFPGKPQYSTLAQPRLPRSILTIFFSINPQYPTPKQPMLPSSGLYSSQKTPKSQLSTVGKKNGGEVLEPASVQGEFCAAHPAAPTTLGKNNPHAGTLQELRPGW